MERRKRIKITRKLPKFTRRLKFTRQKKYRYFITRMHPKLYVVRPFGACKYFKDVNHWSNVPVLMEYSKAKTLKALLGLKFYGDFRIETIK